MHNVLLNKRIKLSFRVQFYLAIPVNILLWGSDSWALSTDLCRKLKTCHNKFTRHLCGITRWHCREYHISMNDIFERLNIASINKIIDLRMIRFLKKVAMQPLTRLTRRIMNSQAVPVEGYKLPKNRLSTRKTYKDVLVRAGMTKSGHLDEWIPKLQNKANNSIMEENLGLPKGSISRKNAITYY